MRRAARRARLRGRRAGARSPRARCRSRRRCEVAGGLRVVGLVVLGHRDAEALERVEAERPVLGGVDVGEQQAHLVAEHAHEDEELLGDRHHAEHAALAGLRPQRVARACRGCRRCAAGSSTTCHRPSSRQAATAKSTAVVVHVDLLRATGARRRLSRLSDRARQERVARSAAPTRDRRLSARIAGAERLAFGPCPRACASTSPTTRSSRTSSPRCATRAPTRRPSAGSPTSSSRCSPTRPPATIRVERVEVTTPVAPAMGVKLADPRPLVVPILRAGLGMLDGMMRLLPTAEVGFLGHGPRRGDAPGLDVRRPRCRTTCPGRQVLRARPDARHRRHAGRRDQPAARPRRHRRHRDLPARRARGLERLRAGVRRPRRRRSPS